MNRGKTCVVLLAGLNLLLLGLLILNSFGLPAARAQSGGGRPGDFSVVTAKAGGQSYDVVYILDRPARRLHALYPTPRGGFTSAQFRDLKADFNR